MTPLDLDKPAGKYVITASVDGRQVEERVDRGRRLHEREIRFHLEKIAGGGR